MASTTETRFCVDCKWMRKKQGLLGVKMMCGHPEMVDQVYGKPKTKCVDAREWYMPGCNEEGRLYEPAN